jgi:hypothetical protein
MRVLLVLLTAAVFASCVGEPPVPCTKCGTECVDTRVDPSNCGSCGTVCAAGKICTSGSCKDNCPATQKACGGKCVDTTNDPQNCGACGMNCGSGKLCSGSQCVDSCPPTQEVCGGKCVDKQTDNAHCGMCGMACTAGNMCSNGMCAATCAAPLTACNGKCVNFTTDPANCGGCGTACAPTNALAPVCLAGTCSYSRCANGFSDCDGNQMNGCEANTASDTTNCGACRNVCLPLNVKVKPPPVPDAGTDAGVVDAGAPDAGSDAGVVDAGIPDAGQPCGPLPDGGTLGPCYPPQGAVCIASSCGYEECAPGFADCDGVPSNGCESNVKTSLTHCGACNAKCAGPDGVCVDGTCFVDRPSFHFPAGGQLFPMTEPQYWEAGRVRNIVLSFAAIPPATLYYTTNGNEPQVDGGGGTTIAGNNFKLPNTGDVFVKWFAVYGDGRRELHTQTYRQTVNPGGSVNAGGIGDDVIFPGGAALRVVDGGTPLSFTMNYQTWKSGPTGYCPGCIVVGGVTFDGVGRLDCQGSAPIYPGLSGNQTLTPAAPMAPGTYFIRYYVGQLFNCTMIGGGGEPIGVVVVR